MDSWTSLLQHLQAEHPNDAQLCGRLERAVRLLREGCEELERAGHQFHLEEGQGAPWPEWPRMMFHSDAAPNGRLVRSRWEAGELGPGWFFTLADAQHWDGTEAQWAGRGGVPRKSLPALLPGASALNSFDPVAERARIIAEFRAKREGGGDAEQQ